MELIKHKISKINDDSIDTNNVYCRLKEEINCYDLNYVKQEWYSKMSHHTAFFIFICFTLFFLLIGMGCLLLKLAQFSYINESSLEITEWSRNQWILFIGFCNQLWNICDIEAIKIDTIYQFIFTKQDGIYTRYIANNISRMDAVIKQTLCDFHGIQWALSFDSNFLHKLLIQDTYDTYTVAQLVSYKEKITQIHYYDVDGVCPYFHIEETTDDYIKQKKFERKRIKSHNISSHNILQNNMSSHNSFQKLLVEDKSVIKCICGGNLMLCPKGYCYDNPNTTILCDGCNKKITENKEIVWHCPKRNNHFRHKKGYDLCSKCSSKPMGIKARMEFISKRFIDIKNNVFQWLSNCVTMKAKQQPIAINVLAESLINKHVECRETSQPMYFMHNIAITFGLIEKCIEYIWWRFMIFCYGATWISSIVVCISHEFGGPAWIIICFSISTPLLSLYAVILWSVLNIFAGRTCLEKTVLYLFSPLLIVSSFGCVTIPILGNIWLFGEDDNILYKLMSDQETINAYYMMLIFNLLFTSFILLVFIVFIISNFAMFLVGLLFSLATLVYIILRYGAAYWIFAGCLGLTLQIIQHGLHGLHGLLIVFVLICVSSSLHCFCRKSNANYSRWNRSIDIMYWFTMSLVYIICVGFLISFCFYDAELLSIILCIWFVIWATMIWIIIMKSWRNRNNLIEYIFLFNNIESLYHLSCCVINDRSENIKSLNDNAFILQHIKKYSIFN